MSLLAIVLLIALVLLYSEYSAKARYVKRLQDAIHIAHNATGFLFKLRQASALYEVVYSDEHPIAFDETTELLNNIVEEVRYWQTLSDVEAVNNLSHLQRLAAVDDAVLSKAVNKLIFDSGVPLDKMSATLKLNKIWELVKEFDKNGKN